MVELESESLDAVFHALADATRRGMLHRLSAQECTVGELAAPFRMSLAAASKHVRVLERAGLVERTVQGREHRLRLNAGPLQEAAAWLEHYRKFWNERLDALESYLAKQNDQ